MRYPTLPTLPQERRVVDSFRGYNHNLRAQDGEWYTTTNLTSDYYPVLATRKARGKLSGTGAPSGMVACDTLCYADGADLVVNGYHVAMGLSTDEEDLPKTLVAMGGYIIVLPDKKWLNTLDLTDFGNIEASFESYSDINFELCDINGNAYANPIISGSEPESPANMDLWIDTGSTPHTLKQYSEASGLWVTIPTTYVKIAAVGIGLPFEQYDGVQIGGILDESLVDLNGSHVIWEKGDNHIVVVGMIDQVMTQTEDEGTITVKREMPVLDYVCEAGNRLWGCHYGIARNGEVVNEIYASKLGDFRNWETFMGISTDSWRGSVGSDGRFTGAVALGGYPIFFKETCLHKIYISPSGGHQVQDTVCRGVARGSERSLAIVNERLYYKSRTGVCCYDGSLPEEISYALGDVSYTDAVGGSIGNKYYINMSDAAGYRHLFVYDTLRNMWHREDDLTVSEFCTCRGELYALTKTGEILGMLGGGEAYEDTLSWVAETGDLMLENPDAKYINRLLLRLSSAEDATIRIYAEYDKFPEWESIGEYHGGSLGSVTLPIRPRRCDHLRLRFEGKGEVRLYSITKYIVGGSDKP